MMEKNQGNWKEGDPSNKRRRRAADDRDRHRHRASGTDPRLGHQRYDSDHRGRLVAGGRNELHDNVRLLRYGTDMWPAQAISVPMNVAIEIMHDAIDLAEATAEKAIETASDLASLSMMFLARASQSLYSVGVLSERGLVGDALSVARTVVELSLDYAYIVKDASTRIAMFRSYDRVSKFKLAKAVDKFHTGAVPQAVLTALMEERDTHNVNYPDSDRNWAGKTIRDRAVEAGRESMYTLMYTDMCDASHSGYGTLEYALIDLDGDPKVHFGHMTPTARPVTLAAVAMAMMIGDVITACKLEQAALLIERVKALAAKLDFAATATTPAIPGPERPSVT